MTRKLCYSLVASFTGEHPDVSEDFYPSDMILSDVIRAWHDATGETVEPGEPFDSEYNYLAREGGIPRRVLDRLEEVDPEVRRQMLAKIREHWRRESFWTRIADVQVNGILTREQLFGFFEVIGAEFDTVATGGTLGGPLGFHVPDVSFRCESSVLIDSIRITPVLCELQSGQWVPVRPPSQSQWDRLASIFERFDTWKILKREAIEA